MEATVLGFLRCPGPELANFDVTGSDFLAETGVVGAEGIFSYKSLGSLIAGLTMGYFVFFDAIFSDSWPEFDLRTEAADDLETGVLTSESRTMLTVDTDHWSLILHRHSLIFLSHIILSVVSKLLSFNFENQRLDATDGT